jgi:hypothetical protein
LFRVWAKTLDKRTTLGKSVKKLIINNFQENCEGEEKVTKLRLQVLQTFFQVQRRSFKLYVGSLSNVIRAMKCIKVFYTKNDEKMAEKMAEMIQQSTI